MEEEKIQTQAKERIRKRTYRAKTYTCQDCLNGDVNVGKWKWSTKQGLVKHQTQCTALRAEFQMLDDSEVTGSKLPEEMTPRYDKLQYFRYSVDLDHVFGNAEQAYYKWRLFQINNMTRPQIPKVRLPKVIKTKIIKKAGRKRLSDYKCPTCGEGFDSSSKKATHVYRVHRD